MGTKPRTGVRGKRELINYDWILEQSEELICIPMSERTRQLLITILPPARWLKRYYSPSDGEITQENVSKFHDDAMYQLLEGSCEMTECPDPCPDPCPELPDWIIDPPPWITDPDERPPWYTDPSEPPGGIPDPPVPGEGGVPIGQDICCLQAANAELTIARLTQQLVAETLGATNPFALASLIMGFFQLFGFPALAVLMTLAAYLLQNIEALEEDLTNAFDALRCALLATCTDGTWSSIEAVKAEISSQVNEPIASYFNALMDALQTSGLMAAAAMGELTEFDCADCGPCACEDCSPGAPTTYQENDAAITFSTTPHEWSLTSVSEQCQFNNDDPLGTWELNLGEVKCVKSITMRLYENVAHTSWLAVNMAFPDDGISDEELAWLQGSTGWSNHVLTFDTPQCISRIVFSRGANAGSGNNTCYLSSVTVNVCE